jgi:hypothetical protein
MKTLKLTIAIVVIFFVASSNYLRAQTYQFEWTLNCDGGMAWCLNHPISGFMTYHVTFHLDPQTGLVDRQFNNVRKYDLVDLQTGEKLICIDTSVDDIGINWWWWNEVLGTGLTFPDQESWPTEGRWIASNFRYMSRGGTKYQMSFFFQLHRNASGEIIVNNYREVIDCN